MKLNAGFYSIGNRRLTHPIGHAVKKYPWGTWASSTFNKCNIMAGFNTDNGE